MNPAEQQPPTQDGNVLGAAAAPTQGPPQLPPQMFTTAAQLLDLTDSRYPFTVSAHSLQEDTLRMSYAKHRFQPYRKTHASPT